MKVLLKLCYSIAHKNPGFSFGLFIMSALSAAIVFLGANFGACAKDTMFTFLEECNAPDAVYVTEFEPCKLKDDICNVEGVKEAYSGFVSDVQVETKNGDVFSLCLFTLPDESPFNSVVNASAKTDENAVKVSISYFFGEHNNINPGDRLLIDTPHGQEEICVGEWVSNFKTLDCRHDEMSAYEEYQYGYIFIKESDFARVFGKSDLANQWFVYFDDDYEPEQQKNIMDRVEKCFKGGATYKTLVKSSEQIQSLYDDLDSIKVLCIFVPGIIELISLGFSFLFIRQVIENQRSKIGLLRALGYEKFRILRIFIAYTVLILILSMLVGIPAGKILLSFATGTFGKTMGITEPVINIQAALTIVMYLIICAIGVLACVLSTKAIAEIDPAKAYGKEEEYPDIPPKFLKRLKVDAFFKISFLSMFRNYKKVIVGALCITACIVSMSVGFEGVASVGYPIDAVYGGRYKYDFIVKNIKDASLAEKISDMPEVQTAEPIVMFQAQLKIGDTNQEVKVQTASEEATLLYLNDAKQNKLTPGNGIIIDEMLAKAKEIKTGDTVYLDGMELEVTGIAREILYTVMYVSPETASKLGYTDADNLMIKLKDGHAVSSVEKKIADINDEVYFVNFDSQKEKIRDDFRAMRTIMFILAMLAFLIGSFLVINTSIINFNEKKSRYVTLKALGTPMHRLLAISFSENLIKVILGVIAAIPLSYICVAVLLEQLSNQTHQYIMVNHSGYTLLTCGITILYVILGVIITMVKVKKLDIPSYLNRAE